MFAIGLLALPGLIKLATSLFDQYVKDGHPKADIPSVDDLKTIITRLVGNGIGNVNLNSPPAINDVLEMVTFLKQQKGLGGVADFLSKSDLGSLISTCLGDVAEQRPQVDKSDVDKKVQADKDFCYSLSEPFPTVQGDIEKAKRLVKQAFQVWRRVANIRFADFTDHADACDLVIVQRTIDEQGGTLAIGTVGGGRGDKLVKELVFDTSEGDWKDRGKFFLTACHETGHLLGLVHGGALKGDLMWPNLEKSISNAVMDQLEATNPKADDVLQGLATGKQLIDGGDTLLSANDVKRVVDKWGTPEILPESEESLPVIPKPEDIQVV